MTLASISLGGFRGTDARLSLPAWGASYAEVTLDSEQTIAGATALVIADLTVQCTVLSGGPAQGCSFYRVVAGAGGWDKTIPAKSYTNDAGVKLSTVLTDAASACGETFDTSTIDPSAKLGPYYVRDEDQACRLLEKLAPGAWYVGEDGKTRLGARPASSLTSTSSTISQVDLARATVSIASDTIAGILPGIVVNGITAVDVEHTASAKDGLSSKLWGLLGGVNSTFLASFRAILDQLDPDRKFRSRHEYRVVSQTGERLDLQAVLKSTGMPDIRGVMVRPGIAGAKSQAALGARVIVTFVNADPGRPAVIGFEDPEGGGFVPINSTIDASGAVNVGPSASSVVFAGGTLGVARQGDPVTSFFPRNMPITYVLGSQTLTGVCDIYNPISGVITGGSTTVKVK